MKTKNDYQVDPNSFLLLSHIRSGDILLMADASDKASSAIARATFGAFSHAQLALNSGYVLEATVDDGFRISRLKPRGYMQTADCFEPLFSLSGYTHFSHLRHSSRDSISDEEMDKKIHEYSTRKLGLDYPDFQELHTAVRVFKRTTKVALRAANRRFRSTPAIASGPFCSQAVAEFYEFLTNSFPQLELNLGKMRSPGEISPNDLARCARNGNCNLEVLESSVCLVDRENIISSEEVIGAKLQALSDAAYSDKDAKIMNRLRRIAKTVPQSGVIENSDRFNRTVHTRCVEGKRACPRCGGACHVKSKKFGFTGFECIECGNRDRAFGYSPLTKQQWRHIYGINDKRP